MKLTELEPQFIKLTDRDAGSQHHKVDTLAEADGIRFLCPKCINADGHSVICWFEGRVHDGVKPGPGRWNPTGTGYGDLSFVPGRQSNSVLLIGGCAWHGFVTNGEVTT